ncbi:MAG: hypothetical protein HQM14_11895 [SAR324 cluster bacterium]|nr:hypothetical protein [SAR324 cluster bacterium]
MLRRVAIKNFSNPLMIPGISDEEALLVQLCEYLYESGFLFNDATAQEVDRGAWVLKSFFQQEKELVFQFLPTDLFNKFINYVQEHQWDEEETQNKIRNKIIKAFDRLAYGNHHSFNIRRNIHLSLLQSDRQMLQDFLLYIATYDTLLLSTEETEAVPDEKFSINDLMKMREKLVAKVEGHKFVELLLKDISRQRGGHLPLEVSESKHSQFEPIEFIRPSQQSVRSLQTPDTNVSLKSASTTNASDQTVSPQTTSPGRSQQIASPQPIPSDDIPGEEIMDDLYIENDSSDDEESDVIYGLGRIDDAACERFIQKNPDSAVKFVFRRDITGKALPDKVMQIYEGWEKRGLRRGQVRNYILHIMEWDQMPTDLAILEITNLLKDRIYDLMH